MQFSSTISRYNLFQTVLINEHYLPNNKDSDLVKRSILIDSPGFSSEKLGTELMESFLSNLKILQSLYSLSDITLFFMPATQLNMVSNQLTILELSIMLSMVGAEKLESILQSGKSSEDEDGSALSNILKRLGSKFSKSNPEDAIYQTTAVWEKNIVYPFKSRSTCIFRRSNTTYIL